MGVDRLYFSEKIIESNTFSSSELSLEYGFFELSSIFIPQLHFPYLSITTGLIPRSLLRLENYPEVWKSLIFRAKPPL